MWTPEPSLLLLPWPVSVLDALGSVLLGTDLEHLSIAVTLLPSFLQGPLKTLRTFSFQDFVKIRESRETNNKRERETENRYMGSFRVQGAL